MTQMPIRAFGLVWYRQEDYPTILSIMEDHHVLPATWHLWQMQAEQTEKRIRREGNITVKAYIDPATFPEWCRSRGLNINADARMEYANLIAYQAAGSTH